MSTRYNLSSLSGVAGGHRISHPLQPGRQTIVDPTPAFIAPREMNVVIGGAFQLEHSGRPFEGRPRLAYLSFGYGRDDTANLSTAADLDIFGENHFRETGAIPGFAFHVDRGQSVHLGFLIEMYEPDLAGRSFVADFTFVGI